jgi:CHAD domain-containing protein
VRRLETTLLTFGLNSNPRDKRLLDELAIVRKCAGKVRDMDVLTSDVLTIKQPGEQDCLVELIEHLGAKRKKFARKLHRCIDAENARMRRDLKHNIRRLVRSVKEASARPDDSNIVPGTLAKIVSLYSELMKPVRLGRNNLHEYRLKVKELRNVLQLSNQTTDRKFLERLDEVKNTIGDWHDWEVLNAIAKEVLRHGISCGLMKYLQASTDSKYKRALSLTQHLRHDLIRPRSVRTKDSSKFPQTLSGFVSAIAEPRS